MANRTEQSPGQMLQYLPAIYQEDPFISHYLLAFEKILLGRQEDPPNPKIVGLEETIGDLGHFFDPTTAPEKFLAWLSDWVAFSLRADLGPQQKRQLLANMVQLYRRRGTKGNLQKLLEIFTVLKLTIYEASDVPEFQIGRHATVGKDTYLSGGSPFFFSVRLDYLTAARLDEVLPLTIELRDGKGNPTTSLENVTVTLALDPKTGAFDTRLDGVFDGTLTTVDIPANQTSAIIFFKPIKAQDVVLMATAPGLQAVTQRIPVLRTPDTAASRLAISGITAVRVGEVLPLTIELRDANGNPATAPEAVTVELTLSPIVGAFDSRIDGAFDGTLTTVDIPANQTSAVILYKAPKAGNRILMASAPALRAVVTRALPVIDSHDDEQSTQVAIKHVVSAGPILTRRQIAIVRALIELEKPAHTDYELELVYPTVQIGLRSTVGVDTLLSTMTDTQLHQVQPTYTDDDVEPVYSTT